MENVFAVANYFITKSLETGIQLTPMKLLKLVYIAHGWHLGIKNEPLILEGVQAWKFGPVIPRLYHSLKSYGNSNINSVIIDPETMTYPIVEDKNLKIFLNRIWDVYSKYSGLQLSTLTHQIDTPWDIVYNREGGKNIKEALIRNNLIEQHYKMKAAI
jgi:uncharacterized phage-associated protein